MYFVNKIDHRKMILFPSIVRHIIHDYGWHVDVKSVTLSETMPPARAFADPTGDHAWCSNAKLTMLIRFDGNSFEEVAEIPNDPYGTYPGRYCFNEKTGDYIRIYSSRKRSQYSIQCFAVAREDLGSDPVGSDPQGGSIGAANLLWSRDLGRGRHRIQWVSMKDEKGFYPKNGCIRVVGCLEGRATKINYLDASTGEFIHHSSSDKSVMESRDLRNSDDGAVRYRHIHNSIHKNGRKLYIQVIIGENDDITTHTCSPNGLFLALYIRQGAPTKQDRLLLYYTEYDPPSLLFQRDIPVCHCRHIWSADSMTYLIDTGPALLHVRIHNPIQLVA